ncbi:SDR family oxidoreductase [Serratia symbiotica]|uniref:SDR family oxidoreductase n=1 Tax=Serratia symbiotica TaxID=138074 RepID=UPI001DAF7AE9|nr:SDR family oxidoreductase [Serratia symbiotica]MCX2957361.1 SDR family oxidoreductase [Serratia symbiotica]NIG87181.1 SDR family oxidoreductase [Serratia symbiotica]USS96130.1 SDR family oxidoreductase [Serratia symbiotica]
MKKVAIIGLGWLGMPLALSLMSCRYEVVGSKTTPDGVRAARMSGIECYQLVLTQELLCEPGDLDSLLRVDALVVTLPARRSIAGSENYCNAVCMLAYSAMASGVPRVIFISSTSVYGETVGILREDSPLRPSTPSGRVLAELERWLHELPHTSVDILRLAGLVGADRHPGRFLAGKIDVKGGSQGVNLVHQDDVMAAIQRLLKLPKGGHVYNLCAPNHPARQDFYPVMAQQLHLEAPQFADEAEQVARLVDGSRICDELGFEYQHPDPARMPVS